MEPVTVPLFGLERCQTPDEGDISGEEDTPQAQLEIDADAEFIALMTPEDRERFAELPKKDPDMTTGPDKHTKATLKEEILLREVPGWTTAKLEKLSACRVPKI